MNKQEKIKILQDKHLTEWIEIRKKVDHELSYRQPVICICGRLATGLHESGCKRFNELVNSETVKRLAHLVRQSAAKGREFTT